MSEERVQFDIDELYRTHSGMVYRRVRKFFSAQEAEEVLHEIFVRVIGSSAHWRGDSKITTWLYQVTTRHCLNRLRDAKRRNELVEEYGMPDWSRSVQQPGQDSAVFLRELWRKLDDERAMIGVYHFLDGLTHEEIARVMEISRRTVGNRLESIRQLAAQLSDESSGDGR
jgi:RNA polymerase sigma-70 factor, ECF subfamily